MRGKTKKITIGLCSVMLFCILISNYGLTSVLCEEGPPSPEEVFIDQDEVGHNFDEDNFDIMVSNNSNWQVDDPAMGIDNQTTWVNNTWNMKWIKEGAFEMSFLAFMNKSQQEDGEEALYISPAQMWLMHYILEGHEIAIGNMLTAWFGYEDDNSNEVYDEGEHMTPFMMMSTWNKETRDEIGIDLKPGVDVTPLARSTSGSTITYTWAFNYTNAMFYLPKVNDSSDAFKWGFNYTDPGSYADGSFGAGVFDSVYYDYTLEIDQTAKTATLAYDYVQGELVKLWMNNTGSWVLTNPGDPDYMPESWALCIGNWAFIMAGTDQDYEMLNTDGSEINASSSVPGLQTVQTKVSGVRAFDFGFSQKPQYDITNKSNPSQTDTHNVAFETIDVVNNDDFINVVSGMTQLIGPFAQLYTSYVINQTNDFVNGIPFQEAWDFFDPESTAGLFVASYPEYGAYRGGVLDHDPTFVAYFGEGGGGIPGYSTGILLVTIGFAVAAFVVGRRKKLIAS